MTVKICIHCKVEQDITLFEINKKNGLNIYLKME
jgi:hypothetical protein